MRQAERLEGVTVACPIVYGNECNDFLMFVLILFFRYVSHCVLFYTLFLYISRILYLNSLFLFYHLQLSYNFTSISLSQALWLSILAKKLKSLALIVGLSILEVLK